MRSPLNFLKYWRKHGWKKTWDDSKYNYVVLDTPVQLLKKELYGHATALLGFLIAFGWAAGTGNWWLIVLFLGMTYVQYVQFKQKLLHYNKIKKLEAEFDKEVS